MRVLVTGASGFIGSAVVRELVEMGHQVIGLVRSATAAGILATLGAEAFAADLREREKLRAAISSADGVIHTAFNHDFTRFQENCQFDRELIEFMGAQLRGSARPLVITSALGVLPQRDLVTEEMDPVPLSAFGANPRAASEVAADAVANTGVPVSIIRLPPSVHGEGDHGFIPTLIGIAKAKGLAAYVGEGDNQWPAVHRFDAAKLYRLALEQGAAYARYHAVAEEGVTFRDIASHIGAGLALPVVSIGAEAAAAHFGWFNHFAAMNIKASGKSTRARLHWTPIERTLLTDLSDRVYYRFS
jgi:nucleoside-diphosphate-sugar epimerase